MNETPVPVAAVIKLMSKVAANTKDDKLSCTVAKVADRLAHVGSFFESRLTQNEIKIIRPFVKAAKEKIPA